MKEKAKDKLNHQAEAIKRRAHFRLVGSDFHGESA
jgi:hypothetical protein